MNQMLSLNNLLKCMFILTLFLCVQIRAASINLENNNEIQNAVLHDALEEFLANEPNGFDRQEYRRASLRYHPHIVYKKASLKPIIGQNGKLVFVK